MTEVIIYNILYIIMLPSNKTMFIDEPSGAAMDLTRLTFSHPRSINVK